MDKKRKREQDQNTKNKNKTQKDKIKNEKGNNNELMKNIIIGKIKIKKNNLRQRLINSNGNKEEIESCEIFINGKKKDFTYYYVFPKVGLYDIKYAFKKILKSTNSMFLNCNSLISLDFSDFNTQNITNMNFMFCGCNSLE